MPIFQRHFTYEGDVKKTSVVIRGPNLVDDPDVGQFAALDEPVDGCVAHAELLRRADG